MDERLQKVSRRHDEIAANSAQDVIWKQQCLKRQKIADLDIASCSPADTDETTQIRSRQAYPNRSAGRSVDNTRDLEQERTYDTEALVTGSSRTRQKRTFTGHTRVASLSTEELIMNTS